MSGATNTEEAAILNARNDVSGHYIGLFTTTPTDDTGANGVEVSGGSYARVAIASTDWNAASAGAPTTKTGPKSGVSWTFPTSSGAWGTAVGFGIFDASTAGNLLYYGALAASVAVVSGDVVQFDSSNVVTLQLGDPGDTF